MSPPVGQQHSSAAGPPARRLSVGLYFESTLQEQGLTAEMLSEMAHRTSSSMATSLSMALQVVTVDALPFSLSQDTSMIQFEAWCNQSNRPKPEVTFLITQSSEPLKSIHKAVEASYLGRTVVLRFGPETDFSKGGRDFIASGKSKIQFAIGRIFGGLPSCISTVLSPSRRPLPYRPLRWLSANVGLINAHRKIDLKSVNGSPALLPKPIIARVIDQLRTAPDGLRCQAQRDVLRRRALLVAAQEKQALVQSGNLASRARDYALEDALGALAKGELREAFLQCSALVEQDPDLPGAARCAGQASEVLDDGSRAIFYYRVHLAAWPDDLEIVMSLAKLLGRRGDDAAALSLLRHAVHIAGSSMAPRINLGIALARMGQLREARKAWREIIAMDPDNQDAIDLLNASGGADASPP